LIDSISKFLVAISWEENVRGRKRPGKECPDPAETWDFGRGNIGVSLATELGLVIDA